MKLLIVTELSEPDGKAQEWSYEHEADTPEQGAEYVLSFMQLPSEWRVNRVRVYELANASEVFVQMVVPAPQWVLRG